MTDQDMTDQQREIILHALGAGKGTKPPYRRHFVTGPGSRDFDDCRALAEAGFMVDHGTRGGLYGGDHLFLVTSRGAEAVGYPLPTD